MIEAAPLRCTLALPPGYRVGDVLAFHRRDVQELAERVDASGFSKGLAWRGRPACLRVAFGDGGVQAELAIAGAPLPEPPTSLEALLRRMLGLDQPVEAFERAFDGHAQIGALLARRPGLRVPLAATPFEALSWAVTGQQISVGAALSLRRRLIDTAGLRHPVGLACYPDAAAVARLSIDQLRGAGFSLAKAQTLLAIAQAVEEGGLPLEAWLGDASAEEIGEQLLALRGVGPWTVSYTLLRGYGRLDGSLHGDAAVRAGLQALLDAGERIPAEAARIWLAQFAPWRALVAAHLWALRSAGEA